jgi:hypothetical protein
MIAPRVDQHRAALTDLCRRHHVQRLELFGSAATGTGFDPVASDLDFIVEFKPLPPDGHFDTYFDLRDALSELFNRPIDLVVERAITNRYFLESINQTRTTLYAA